MSQTLRERRALSQRSLTPGEKRELVENTLRVCREAHETDMETRRSVQMCGALFLALAFVGLCAVVAVALADYLSDGAFSGAPVPRAIERSVA